MIHYHIIRIVAGDLPPRDPPGSRHEALRFILENEPPLAAAKKTWLVNYIHDERQRAQTINTLEAFDADYQVLEFDRSRYRRATTARKQLALALNINGARNTAIDLGVCEGRLSREHFTLPLDGECYFTEDAWQRLTLEVQDDQRRQPGRQYYSIPMFRVAGEAHAIENLDVSTVAPDEPQLVFRGDAGRRFDELLPWGEKNKLALLLKLGHVHGPGHAEYLPRRSHCASAGYVYHLEINQAAGFDLRRRSVERRKAAGRLLDRLNAPFQV